VTNDLRDRPSTRIDKDPVDFPGIPTLVFIGFFFGGNSIVKHYKFGGHSIAPKTASANGANAKLGNRQMIGRPIIL